MLLFCFATGSLLDLLVVFTAKFKPTSNKRARLTVSFSLTNRLVRADRHLQQLDFAPRVVSFFLFIYISGKLITALMCTFDARVIAVLQCRLKGFALGLVFFVKHCDDSFFSTAPLRSEIWLGVHSLQKQHEPQTERHRADYLCSCIFLLPYIKGYQEKLGFVVSPWFGPK